jgi:hypothetical protein
VDPPILEVAYTNWDGSSEPLVCALASPPGPILTVSDGSSTTPGPLVAWEHVGPADAKNRTVAESPGAPNTEAAARPGDVDPPTPDHDGSTSGGDGTAAAIASGAPPSTTIVPATATAASPAVQRRRRGCAMGRG